MKITYKKALCLVLAAAMLLCAACGMKNGPAADAAVTPDTVAAAPDSDTVIAEIGGTRTVTYGELAEYYDYYLEMMSYYGGTAPESDEEIEEMQDMLLGDLVNQAKLLYFAEELGMTELTADERAEVESAAHEELESYLDEFRMTAEDEGAADVEARARELLDRDLLDYGTDMNSYEYEEYLTTLYAEDKYLEKLEEHVRTDVTATEEDAAAYYDRLVADQTAEYANDPSLYGDDEEYFLKYGGTPAVVIPEGYARVKVIAILPEGELDAAYTEKTAKMVEYENEYGKLALSGAEENTARLKDIETLYAALKIETAAMYGTYFATAREEADAAYAALEAGTPFDEVLSLYGEDADYVNYPALKENGRPLYLLGDKEGERALREAAKMLSAGSYSGIIQTDSALYILYLVKEETGRTVPLADVHDAVLTAAALGKGDTAWEDQQTAWEADDSMVKTYPERYRSVGK